MRSAPPRTSGTATHSRAGPATSDGDCARVQTTSWLLESQPATLRHVNTATPTPLARGATLDDLARAGQATIPVHHDQLANAADLLGCGRALAFRMANDGRLPVIRLGRRVVVPVAQLRAMLDGTSHASSTAGR